jgi:hypothetical protein
MLDDEVDDVDVVESRDDDDVVIVVVDSRDCSENDVDVNVDVEVDDTDNTVNNEAIPPQNELDDNPSSKILLLFVMSPDFRMF